VRRQKEKGKVKTYLGKNCVCRGFFDRPTRKLRPLRERHRGEKSERWKGETGKGEIQDVTSRKRTG